MLDNEEIYEWLKKVRYEGRNEVPYKEDSIDLLGWNMYMTPQQAAHGLALMQNYPEHMPDLIEEGGYRDLRDMPVFQRVRGPIR
jgi:dTDP-4-amino-4,6-dideoxygalactose transaminase